MSRGFQVSASIDRPVTDVWAFVTDWDKAPEWMRGIESFRPLDEGPVGPGSRFGFQSRGAERESIVIDFEPESRLTLESTQGGVTALYDYRFEPAAGATRVTLDARCTARGAWRLIHPLITFMMKRVDGAQLDALKRAVESRSASA